MGNSKDSPLKEDEIRAHYVFDMYGSGDAVIGINPATDRPDTVYALLNMLDNLIRRFEIPTQSCVLSHITTTLELVNKNAPVDLIFQSVGGTEKTNTSFGINLALLQEACEAGLSLNRGTIGNNIMAYRYFAGFQLGY